jgi:nucleoside-diphosphate-sugar epimerase
MRSVLVTGGAGFIGSHVVDQLLEGGASVRVLDNLSTGSAANLQAAAERHSRGSGALNGSRLEVIVGDIRDRELLRKALRGVNYVCHLAALPATETSLMDPGDIHSVNVEGTLNLLHGALTEGVWRVVIASCASVYGAPDALDVAEEAPLRPTTLFGASKVAAETYALAFHARHKLDTVVLRYFSVYGPRQKAVPGGPVVPNLIESLSQGRPFLDQDEWSAEDFMYVDDAVAATLAAARAPRASGRVINVGSGQMVSVADVRGILADLLRVAPVSGGRAGGAPRPHGICTRSTVAGELLDFAPRVSLIGGLARVVSSMSRSEHSEYPKLAPVALDD